MKEKKWQSLLPALLAMYTESDKKSVKAAALQELKRMAREADRGKPTTSNTEPDG